MKISQETLEALRKSFEQSHGTAERPYFPVCDERNGEHRCARIRGHAGAHVGTSAVSMRTWT